MESQSRPRPGKNVEAEVKAATCKQEEEVRYSWWITY